MKRLEFTSISGYTGNALKDYAKVLLMNVSRERVIVPKIRKYINSESNDVLILSGIRGTGKTSALMQAVDGKEDQSLFLTLIKDDIEVDDLISFVFQKLQSKPNISLIIIDEITRLNNLSVSAVVLYEKFSLAGYKVILSGTASASLILAKNQSLYHRSRLLNSSYISYSEVHEIFGCSLEDFYKSPDLKYLQDKEHSTFLDFPRIFDSLIVDNIFESIQRNQHLISNELLSLSIEDLRLLLYLIIYSVIFTVDSVKDGKLYVASFSRVINLLSVDKLSRLELSDLNKDLASRISIAYSKRVSASTINLLLDLLRDLGVLVHIDNVCSQESKWYLVNPFIANQVYNRIVLVTKDLLEDYEISQSDRLRGIYGSLYESIVVVDVLLAKKYGEAFVGYARNDIGELDIVALFGDPKDCESDLFSEVYEVKLTADLDAASNRAVWINDESFYNSFSELRDFNVQCRAVIYGGPTCIFNGFKDISKQKNFNGVEPSVIEWRNKGLKFINCEEFLLNI